MFGVAVLTLAVGGVFWASGSNGDGEALDELNIAWVAEKLIEGELADVVGLGELEAKCQDVKDDAEVGTEFTCTGTTTDGQVVDFIAVIDREDHVDVNTTNLISAEALPHLETAATNALSLQLGAELPADSVDCGDDLVVLGADLVFVCAFHAPDSSDVYDITFEFTDLESGDFNVKVAETPRG